MCQILQLILTSYVHVNRLTEGNLRLVRTLLVLKPDISCDKPSILWWIHSAKCKYNAASQEQYFICQLLIELLMQHNSEARLGVNLSRCSFGRATNVY